MINEKCGNPRRILLLEENSTLFVLVNMYNANNEPDQLKTIIDLGTFIDSVGDIQNKNIISGNNFNEIFDFFLEV